MLWTGPAPDTRDYDVVYEIGPEEAALSVGGKELFRGPHGLKKTGNAGKIIFILRGCNWQEPRGKEVWFDRVRIESRPLAQ